MPCRLFLAIFFALTDISLLAQCPLVDFNALPSGCLNQRFYLDNTSAPADNYSWDFCSGDLLQTPTTSIVATNPSLFRARVFRAVQNEVGLWYGFAIDQPNSQLIKLAFGDNIDNTPTLTNLNNPGSKFQNPTDLRLWKEGPNWYGLVANTAGNNVLLLNFGSSLDLAPTVVDLGSMNGMIKSPGGVFIAKDGNTLMALVSNGSPSEMVMLNFGTSILNAPVASTFSIAGASGLRSVALISECDRWFGLVTSYNTNELYYLDFVNGLSQTPNTGLLTIPSASYSFPASVSLANEGGEFYAFIQSAFPAQVYKIAFGSSIVDRTGSYTNLGNFGISNDNGAFEIASVSSTWRAFSIDLSGAVSGSGRLVMFTFPEACSTSVKTFTGATPPPVSYATPGNYRIALTGQQNSGIVNYKWKEILVSGSTSPDVSFSTQNTCAQNNVNFNSSNLSGNISSYSWNFGDGVGVSSAASPTYVYSTANKYSPTLTVTASNGCQNTIQNSIQIFNPPQADFTLPAASPVCTNQNYSFNNTSTFDAGSNPTWQWSINGSPASSSQNLSYTFANTSSQTIALQASIPGCSSSATKTISSLSIGPLVNFSIPSTACQQNAISFSNTTTGTVTSYQWTFGDGNTSASTNATNTYANIGSYSVMLQANNAAGCQNTATKTLTVYSKPQPDFSIGLPPFSCAGTSSQFTDQTPSPTDSNITGWQWLFGDAANGTSTQRSPNYNYVNAGNYNVSLTATTNFGCSGAIQKSVTISPSPVASFTNSIACIGQLTQFSDNSTGNIRSRAWTIQGNSFSTPNVQFAFASAGSFPVALTVTGTNNCISQLSKNIVVPVAPSLDFSVQAPCNTNPTVFTEVTSGTDTSVSQLWNFASLANGSGPTSQFVFATTGNYSVQLRSTRQSGCVYSITKSVNIVQGPVADFTPSTDIGGPPLPVSFTNNSSNASNYLWKFGDAANSTSTSVNPNFTFAELGVYAVKLTASNALGCSFTTSKPITVLVPNINVQLSDLKMITDATGALLPMLTISNLSNLPITNPDVLLDVESVGQIKKKISGRILPNQTLSAALDLQIIPRAASYFCAELAIADNTAEFGRRRCLPLQSNEVLFSPYPNPAKEVLNLDWVSVDALPVTILIFNPAGEQVLKQQFTSVASGLNRFQIITSALPNGLYFISYSDGKTSQTFRVSIMNN